MITDKIGQEIKPGSIIVYGHALGRSAGLRIGKVVSVAGTEEQHMDRIVRRYQIKVWGLNDDWGRWRAPQLNTKTGTLEHPERIIVLDETKVPARITDFLASVVVPVVPEVTS